MRDRFHALVFLAAFGGNDIDRFLGVAADGKNLPSLHGGQGGGGELILLAIRTRLAREGRTGQESTPITTFVCSSGQERR